MPNSKENFTKQFAEQKTKFRPWAVLLLIDTVALTIILPILFFTIKLNKTFITAYITIFAVLIVVALPQVIKVSRCPNCKKYMGRDISKFCPVCGVQIQE